MKTPRHTGGKEDMTGVLAVSVRGVPCRISPKLCLLGQADSLLLDDGADAALVEVEGDFAGLLVKGPVTDH